MTARAWIIAHDATAGDDAYAYECLGCGQKQRVALPIALDVWIAGAKAFSRLHRGCGRRWKKKQPGCSGSEPNQTPVGL